MNRIPETGKIAEVHTSKIIHGGFAAVLLVIFMVIYFGINRLSWVHDSLSEIVSHEQVAMEMLFNMQESSRNRSALLYKISLINDPFERDEQILLHSKLGGLFVRSRLRLSGLNLDKTENTLLENIKSNVVVNQDIQGRVLEELAADRLQSAQQILNKQALPVQQSLMDSIRLLLEYEISRSHESERLLDNQKRNAIFLLIFGGAIAALIAIVIAIFTNKRILYLVEGLSSSARKLQEANHSLKSLNLAMDEHDIVSIADVLGDITFVNEKFCQISQYTPEELIGKNHRLLNSGVHPDAFFDKMWSSISSGKIWQDDVCNRNKSGSLYWVSSTIVPFLDETGLPYQYISVRTDITAIKAAEQVLLRGKAELEKLVDERTADLHEREEVLHSIASAAQDAVIMIDSNGNVTHWNPAAEKMFGYSAAEINGRNLHALVMPSRYLDAHHAAFPKFIQEGAGPLIGAITEIDAKKRDGTEFPVEISISGVKIKDSWHAVAIVRDITVRRLADEQLKQLANTDALTGAYNRRRFNEVMLVELSRAKRYGATFSLIIFDIDHFKRVNDTFGHQAGDQVLLKLALLMNANIRKTDVFARWGGEEFAILATHCDDECPSNLAEKLRRLIEAYSFSEVGKVTCSFGVTRYREGDDHESMVKRADNSLYLAKEKGRNRVILD